MGALTSDPPPRKTLSIHLDRHAGEPDWHVIEVKADTAHCVSTLWFPQRPILATALVSDLADQLAVELDEYRLPVVDLPSNLLMVPGAALVGLKLSQETRADSSRIAEVSILRVLGNALAALRPEFRPEIELRDESETLATQVLIDLVQPCLDIARASEAGTMDVHRDQLLARLDALRNKSDELEFIAGLLTRLLARQQDGARPLQAKGTHGI